MGSRRFAGFLVVALLGLLITSSSQAYKFYVGGKDGWVLNPSESYDHWAERNRFQVNDTLFFKYKNGTDSVLIVSKDDYCSCNTKSPILSLQDGDSIFKFDRSGPYYFISGDAERCLKGQKLIIVVLAVRNKHHHASPPSPSPVAPPQTPASPPLVPPPKAESPSAEPPENSGSPDSGVVYKAPAPAPAKNSALHGLGGPVLFSCSIVINTLLFSSLVGLF